MNNLGLLFHKSMYEGKHNLLLTETPTADACNEINVITQKIIGEVFTKDDYTPSSLKNVPGYCRLLMKVQYPGLVMGLGYAHYKPQKPREKNSEEAYIAVDNGFSFEYVTGQPYLPGSSVKGMLSSVFRYPQVIREITGQQDLDVKMLEDDIFNHGDVFLDAVIYHGGKDGKILDVDSITPHKDVLTDPTPLHILRVVPGVVMEFRFVLRDSGDFTVQNKLKLFARMMEDFGVGAKTNVGYGRLKNIEQQQEDRYTFPERRVQTQAEPERPSVNQQNTSADRFNRPHFVTSNNRFASQPRLQTTAHQFQGYPQVGSIHEAIINKVRADKKDAFATLQGDYCGKSGRIAIGEVANHYVNDISAQLKRDQHVKVKVIDVRYNDELNKVQMALSIKRVSQE